MILCAVFFPSCLYSGLGGLGEKGEDLLPVCYCRVTAKNILDQGMAGVEPRWMLLSEDKVRDIFFFFS